ncbi:RNA polymerase II transcription factor B subunit 5, partial [Microdochium trichocladiopsis]
GVLVECDPSIKSIIIAIDAERNEYIIEDLDESHLVIQERMVPQLKKKLEEVRQALPS